MKYLDTDDVGYSFMDEESPPVKMKFALSESTSFGPNTNHDGFGATSRKSQD